jgi:hypothetical protein
MKLLPRSADDVVQAPATLDAVEGGFVRVGTTSTGITTTIRVRMSRAATESTIITLESLDPTVFSVPASVTVPASSFGANVDVTGVAAGTAVLRASLGDVVKEASVTVLAVDAPAAVVAASPTTLSLVSGQAQTITWTLDLPAPTGGVTMTLTTDPAVLTAPATIAVPENALSVDVEVIAVAPGTATLTAALGGEVDVEVTVVEVPPLGFVINEIDYDQPSTDSAEFIELFNGTLQPVSLDGAELLLLNGASNGQIYRRIALSGTLPAGRFLVAGPAAVTETLGADVVKVTIATASDIIQNGAPDAVVLVAGGDIIDALSYEGPLPSVTVGDDTVELTVEAGKALGDGDTGAGSVCRNTTGTWGLCTTSSPGAANP